MPGIFRHGQYRFSFYAADGDEPPHVHVGHERRTAKFWINPLVRLADNHGFRPHELNEIERIILSRREELLEAWHGFFPG